MVLWGKEAERCAQWRQAALLGLTFLCFNGELLAKDTQSLNRVEVGRSSQETQETAMAQWKDTPQVFSIFFNIQLIAAIK